MHLARPRLRQAADAAFLASFCAAVCLIAVVAYAVKPTTSESFHLLYGSIFIDDNTAPVAIDLASGKPTVGLHNAFTAVSATSSGQLHLVPLRGGTLMLNTSTGEFNMLDAAGLLLKTTNGGVTLPTSSAPGGTVTAIAAGADAYVVRSTATQTDAYLVGQSTVATAGSKTTPRASGVLHAALASGSGSLATANGALWLLTDAGPRHTIRELSVPAGTDAGVALASSTHGAVNGVAAVESATLHSDGTGADAIAVASAAGLRIIAGDGTSRVLATQRLRGVDEILPVTALHGSFAFLAHTPDGWNLVTAPVTANTPGAVHVHTISGIDGAATLVTPAASGGRFYTAEPDGRGALWQISVGGAAKQLGDYPLLTGERLDFSGGQVEADGARVIINSRANLQAQVIFTDGSHDPVTVDKHSAVQLDPSAAQALVIDHATGPGKPKPNPSPVTKPPAAVTPVNAKIDCSRATQTPHIPVVRLTQRGSRSVQLVWTYPVLDTQDCVPSTYTVSAELVSGDAPSPPGTVTVQGQDGVNLIGLFPAATYRLVVTAYLNGRGTPSAPLTVTTSEEGPPAPTAVTTTVDSSGNWQVHWQSCGGLTAACVPTSSWEIVPQFCDGAGLSSAPPTRLQLGDPTQHSFNYTYTGDDSLLGRGVTFQVVGVGATGLMGVPKSDRTCSYSWTQPVVSDISLAASSPATTTEQGTTDTTVTAHFANGATHDLGGLGGQLTYELLTGGQVVDTAGPTTADTATLHGIRAGVQYEVRAVVNPPRHPEATAIVGPVDVQPAVALWPAPSVAATFADTSASSGTLTLDINFPPGTDSRGETFDLTNSTLDCGNAHLGLDYSNITPGHPITFTGIARATYNSASAPCTVTVALSQNASTATTPPLYGAGSSASATSDPISIDVPSLDVTSSDFTATWIAGTDPAAPQIAVSYTGNDPRIGQHAQNWMLTAQTDHQSDCGTSTDDPTGSPAVINAKFSCVSGSADWTVRIEFTYFGAVGDYTVPVTGTTPAPVDSSQITFTAAWTSDSTAGHAQVEVQYAGPYGNATLDSLNWTATITSSKSPGVVCGSSTAPPQADGTGPAIDVDLTACPATKGPDVATYTLNISYTDPNFGSSGSYQAVVSGAAPS